ncbi:hypothetical protein Q2K19_16945 [Micromonospora soli]|uniref:hypothetical protein n=1 Tax=Micromonospora sp. NBRC 110009 TaxID=3061627 RepID=UPI002673C672|nr:hypothetical protein [Micromonospora sp. NBRC 110009]WKT95938.1 hypothetical protein Q2K19_16945 [Micromonospora sp. NBRC 110009]
MRQEEQQVTQEHPEAVRSAPVPVTPPGDGDGDGDGHRPDRGARTDVPEDALDDRGTFDDPAVIGDRADDRPADDPAFRDAELDETRAYDAREVRDAEAADADADADERPVYHDPAPLPTVFGAATVGDAVAASAMASGRPEDERDARGEDTAAPGDGAPGRTDAFDDERADPTAGDRLHDPDRWAAEHSARDDAPAAGAAGYGSAEPAMVDPDSSTAAAGAGVAGAAAGAGAALAGAARPTPGAVPADAATLFAPETAQGFRDRWRDVQLRFVDDPQAAVGEAQSLVEEAIQALSTALQEQKSKLGGWRESGSADTEQLRVAVRGYRDFLDRVLGR